MNLTLNEKSTSCILVKDLEEIYLGNLHTIDSDLNLPRKGRFGSHFHWKSNETLFISNEGKVTRPTYGVGNRAVSLIVHAEYNGQSAKKEFVVTVLEQPRELVITEMHQVVIESKLQHRPELPSVVIARDDNGINTTLAVKWEEYCIPTEPSVIIVEGTVEETDAKAIAKLIFIQDIEDIEIKPKRKCVSNMPVGSVLLSNNTIFHKAHENMISYLLKTNDDQMLYNFRKAAGLDTKSAPLMTGWDAPECNLKGHTTGHYLSALALGYGVSKQVELKHKIDYMIESLYECQESFEKTGCNKGFLSAYSEEQFILLEEYTTYPTIWAPYYTLDKIMSGLYDCYTLADNKIAFDILCKIGDWIHSRLSRLSRSQLNTMWSLYIAGEFGGIISVMTKLYDATKQKKFLEMAFYFENEKLFFPMSENIDTLKDMHANQHIPQIIGALDIYKVQGSNKYYSIAKNFWRIVTTSHVYCIGGTGETEMFHEPNKSDNYITDKTAESCASYNMLRLTSELFAYEPDSTMMDYYENVLYNHILSSFSPRSDGGTTYFLPLCPGASKEFNTIENTCCHGSGLESRFRYIQDIYSYNDTAIFINLYIPSRVTWQGFQMEQVESLKNSGLFKFTLSSDSDKILAFRIPRWAQQEYTVKLNGQLINKVNLSDGYCYIDNNWKSGDVVEVHIPYNFRKVITETTKTYSSIAYGPYIIAALSNSNEYLICPNFDSLQYTTVSDRHMRFRIEDKEFIPLAEIDDQRYHVYFRN